MENLRLLSASAVWFVLFNIATICAFNTYNVVTPEKSFMASKRQNLSSFTRNNIQYRQLSLSSFASTSESSSGSNNNNIIEVNPESTSLANIRYKTALSTLNQIYPTEGIEERYTKSRSDGYWAYIRNGEEPPLEYTYGEFDFLFFAHLLDRAHIHYLDDNNGNSSNEEKSWKDKTFLDIGSGSGRLVIGASTLHPNMKLCRGIEILNGIHDIAVEKLENIHTNKMYDMRLSPISFECASITSPNIRNLQDVDVCFMFSSCMKGALLNEIGSAIGKQLKQGSIVITTEYSLIFEPAKESNKYFRIMEVIHGYCEVVGGTTTAFVHRVI
eukprot:CAMPEP_0178946632 /NCGR_PEP_ID=MMETSP0789-20121207/4395_1 /TAXON_ID=3005 /ORGANISM="Rhizosolenia setigera, Strain CCMP 1694" /LENGTH=327 /DNA_ID=CAMNT_0020626649 /DNA_START=106 /DNA_END=1089 /DNA_ORIENTATION=-